MSRVPRSSRSLLVRARTRVVALAARVWRWLVRCVMDDDLLERFELPIVAPLSAHWPPRIDTPPAMLLTDLDIPLPAIRCQDCETPLVYAELLEDVLTCAMCRGVPLDERVDERTKDRQRDRRNGRRNDRGA